MASSTTTFRLSSRDRGHLDRLADELLCSRTDVVRLGMAALRENRPLRRQIRADNLARAFLQSLRTQYGEKAVIEFVDGPDDPNWYLAGEPLDSDVADVVVRQQGDLFVMDLIDKANGVGIYNVQAWENADEMRHAVVPLRDLWVYSAHAMIGEPKTHATIDGRTVVEIEEDDGSVRQLALDNNGDSRQLEPSMDVPFADVRGTDPSVGIGVRRESKDGPHLGRGVGGKWHLTGDLERDRAAVIASLNQLIDQTERGELDGILDPERDHEGPVTNLIGD